MCLVRCPFCAELEDLRTVPIVIGSQNGSHSEYFVKCFNCGSCGPNELSANDAVDSWNRRRESKPVPYEFREG